MNYHEPRGCEDVSPLLANSSTFVYLEDVLDNTLLLEKIIEKYEESPADLLKCRLISEKWKQEATTILQRKNWRERNFLNLSTDSILREYLDTISSPLTSREDQLFCCFMVERQSEEYDKELMTRFFEIQAHIKSLSLNFVLESKEQLDKIIKSHSATLKELKIFATAQNLNEKDLEKCDFKLANLDYLCFTHGSERNTPIDKYLNAMKIILKGIPAKKSLKFCLIRWDRLAQTIPVLQQYDQIKNLKVLQIAAGYPNFGKLKLGDLKLLTKASVRLQSLYLDSPTPLFGFEDENDFLRMTQEIYEFLKTQANTLEALSWGSFFKFKFPSSMNVLKKLRLNCMARSSDLDEDDKEQGNAILPNPGITWNRSCGPIFYEHTFPKLEELQLFSENSDSPDLFLNWFLRSQTPCNNIKKIGFHCRSLNVEILRCISSTFPFITSLEFDSSARCFKQCDKEKEKQIYNCIWRAEFATTLQELYIVLPEIPKIYYLDCFFSGLTTNRITEIVRSKRYLDKSFDITEELLLEGQGYSSILNLRSLKKLVVQHSSSNARSSCHFTDFSAFALFGKMLSLEFLHLDKQIYIFSQQAIYHLKTKLTRKPIFPALSSEERIEEVFRTGFNNVAFEAREHRTNKLINLLDEMKNLKVFEMTRYDELIQGKLKLLVEGGVRLNTLALEPSPIFKRDSEIDVALEMTKEIFAFLASQSNSLENLSWESEYKFKFPPYMDRLKKLRLCFPMYEFESDAGVAWNQNCAPIIYTYVFPQIEELRLISRSYTDSLSPDKFLEWFLQPQPPCNTLKKFDLQYPDANMKILQRISTTFPLLTSLKFSYPDDNMEEREIYNWLWKAEFSSTLQELYIKVPAKRQRSGQDFPHDRIAFELDSLFSGVGKTIIKQIFKSGQYKNKDFDLTKEMHQKATILNFKSLKKLVVHIFYSFQMQSGYFTDFSAYAVFGKLPDLEYLHLDICAHDFSIQALNYLESKFPRKPVFASPSDEHIDEEVFRTGQLTRDAYGVDVRLINLLEGTPSMTDFDE